MVQAGDYVTINENVIDNTIIRLLSDGKTKTASRWEGYRNTVFEVIQAQNNGLIQICDFQGHKLELSKKAYAQATGLGKI